MHSAADTKTKLMLVAIGSLVVLYLVSPLLELGVAVAGGDDE